MFMSQISSSKILPDLFQTFEPYHLDIMQSCNTVRKLAQCIPHLHAMYSFLGSKKLTTGEENVDTAIRVKQAGSLYPGTHFCFMYRNGYGSEIN